ncbi:DEAD/DEAH box helicase [Telmatospirillum sp.]|uniref:DEAD/DEAH box helicase n=1 Tax=Telmatospirillum sp. TaxID=2079197 RepID=UPI002850F772|nr:DEAD/DEAH box helicase [Telmatospirillum sp.]MDR3439212.1 DEAD/DEAH box helicase [Telmatospirillum sp.]
MTFADLGLGPEILKAVEEAGYERPTPIQEQAIPVILMGRDVLGVAQTGTGKTAGFTLPMIEILAGSRAKARMPRSLILAPTRELASQAAENFEIYGKYHRLTMAKLIGGESFVDQEKLLDRGVDVLIATPGRLMDLFDRGRILLNDVKVLVIDEADRMLDMGFIPDVERIVSLLPKIRQTLFFSATMAPEIRRLADAFLMNPKEISVSPESSTATTVEQFLVVCDELDKREALRHLMLQEDVRNALIFCNRKRDVDVLFRSLNKHGIDAVHLHGDMAQSARTETLERFKTGVVRCMVCSDVAARGIDISDLSHVFNFDVPHHAEDYIHRIGRTGRAGKQGRAFTIATPEDGKSVAAIVQLIGNDIPKISIEGLQEQALDMESSGRRRGGGRSHDGRSKDRTRERKPHRKMDTPNTETIAPVETPVASRTEERPQHDFRANKPERERPERAARENNRNDRHRDRNDRGRRYRDDPEIGEMSYPDNVVGFGDAIPDFLARPVPLPSPVEKGGSESESEQIDVPVSPVREPIREEVARPAKPPRPPRRPRAAKPVRVVASPEVEPVIVSAQPEPVVETVQPEATPELAVAEPAVATAQPEPPVAARVKKTAARSSKPAKASRAPRSAKPKKAVEKSLPADAAPEVEKSASPEKPAKPARRRKAAKKADPAESATEEKPAKPTDI